MGNTQTTDPPSADPPRRGFLPYGPVAGGLAVGSALAVLASLGAMATGRGVAVSGVIGAAGTAVLAALYWHARRRLRTLGPIGRSLLSFLADREGGMENGGRSPISLDTQVSDSDGSGGGRNRGASPIFPAAGPETAAWNRLVSEASRCRRALAIEQAGKTIAAHGSGAGLAAACDAMPQGLIVVDRQLHVRSANGAGAVLLGSAPDRIRGTDLGELLHDDGILAMVRAAVAGPHAGPSTVEIDPPSAGQAVLRLSIRPMDDGAAAIVIEDIAQQRVAAEARNSFLAKATHELRTPLMNILLYAENAMEDGEENAALRAQALNVINQEARRLENMVGEILSVSQIEAGASDLQIDDVRLDALFEDLEADYGLQAAEKAIAFLVNLPPKLPVIQGDREKIAVALHNLVGNALKYTPPGGKVEVNVAANHGQLVVAVIDTGIGISPADVERVFDKFYRAEDPRVADITGSGLGLALAREMARLHGGDISLQSEMDKGTTFTLTLPIAEGGMAVPAMIHGRDARATEGD